MTLLTFIFLCISILSLPNICKNSNPNMLKKMY